MSPSAIDDRAWRLARNVTLAVLPLWLAVAIAAALLVHPWTLLAAAPAGVGVILGVMYAVEGAARFLLRRRVAEVVVEPSALATS